MFKPLVNIVIDRFNNSKTELHDLTDYVQMDKNNQECKNNERHTFTIKISMKIIIIIDYDNNYSKVVYGEKLVGFHAFETLNDAPEAYFLTGSFLHPIKYSDSKNMQLRFCKNKHNVNQCLK